MGFPVKVYIYDLSQGMARQMGQALVGRPIEGIWHTAVVVYGQEYFYGGGGIVNCPPGATQLGQPLKVEEVGETEIEYGTFMEYLQAQQRDRFRGDRYDLLRHNCNNFSHETAQFLTGKGIPQHILDLPNEVMSTPMGQMLAPMLEQMNPTGTSIPFTGQGGSFPPPSASDSSGNVNPGTTTTRNLLPVTDYIIFDAALNVDGLAKKLEEFNNLEEGNARLDEGEIKLVIGIAKGLVRLSEENFQVLLKLKKWKAKHWFPLLDILRYKSCKPCTGSQLEQVVDLFILSLQAEFSVNSMLACKGLANIVASDQNSLKSLDSMLTPLPSLLPASTNSLETSLTALLTNISVRLASAPSVEMESCILIASSLVSNVLLDLTQEESVYRALVSLGNTIHAAKGQEEVLQLLLSMDTPDLVAGLASRGEKAKKPAQEILSLLKKS